MTADEGFLQSFDTDNEDDPKAIEYIIDKMGLRWWRMNKFVGPPLTMEKAKEIVAFELKRREEKKQRQRKRDLVYWASHVALVVWYIIIFLLALNSFFVTLGIVLLVGFVGLLWSNIYLLKMSV